MPWPGRYHARQIRPVPKTVPVPLPSQVPAKRVSSFEPVIAKAFGEVVRASRVQMGVAQDQFALLAKIDRSYYGKLERGERQPSLALLLRVASGLEMSGAELVARVESAMDASKSPERRTKR
jgi:DNA-binding XRE family transcriptional regulator